MRTIIYDYTELDERIKQLYGSRAAFCRKTGYSPSKLSQKLSHLYGFTQRDITEFSSWLKIPESKIGRYFFKLRD